ncbi:MAG: hypothetical protein HY735_18285 [Verrucomicrobia bacterium]|nr:hypothetical protein [Verrucomicrobiota bacterium]
MRPEDLREIRDEEPFRPFRLVFTDGRTIPITHQDLLIIGRHTIEVAVAEEPAKGLLSEVIVASPLHVVRVERALLGG